MNFLSFSCMHVLIKIASPFTSDSGKSYANFFLTFYSSPFLSYVVTATVHAAFSANAVWKLAQ